MLLSKGIVFFSFFKMYYLSLTTFLGQCNKMSDLLERFVASRLDSKIITSRFLQRARRNALTLLVLCVFIHLARRWHAVVVVVVVLNKDLSAWCRMSYKHTNDAVYDGIASQQLHSLLIRMSTSMSDRLLPYWA